MNDVLQPVTIVRRANVDRSLSPHQVIDVTGRTRHSINKRVIESMPRGEGDDVEVTFFALDYPASDESLEQEFENRGLKPADPYSLAAVNRDDLAFGQKTGNLTHWKSAGGKWCYAAFYGWREVADTVEARADVNYNTKGQWSPGVWFAGIPK